jgi:hypothetical protein
MYPYCSPFYFYFNLFYYLFLFIFFKFYYLLFGIVRRLGQDFEVLFFPIFSSFFSSLSFSFLPVGSVVAWGVPPPQSAMRFDSACKQVAFCILNCALRVFPPFSLFFFFF